MNVNWSDNDVTVTVCICSRFPDKNIITACLRSCGKVMFLHLCHSVWGDVVPRGGLLSLGGVWSLGVHKKAITEGHFQPEGQYQKVTFPGGVLTFWNGDFLVLAL